MSKVIKDIDQALLSYPLLKRVQKNGFVRVEGEVILSHPKKGEFDRYSMSIHFPKAYPKCFPSVIETSKKIPRKNYRHVNPNSTLCLAVEPEEKGIVKNGISFKFFLDKVLVPHLARETFRELNGSYEDGEYAHGVEGIWEFYENVLESKNREAIINELENVIYSKWQNRNDLCFCRSEKKFKKCHLKKWNEVMKPGREYLISRLELLKNDINEKN